MALPLPNFISLDPQAAVVGSGMKVGVLDLRAGGYDKQLTGLRYILQPSV